MGNFLLGLFGNLLAAEIAAWCRPLAQKIICATVQKLPERLQPRMLEEWSALLEDIPGDLSKLWMALSLYRKRSVLADECEKLIDEPLPSITGVAAFTKRLVDVLISSGGLLILSPLLLIVAFLIKNESPGPVFDRQLRVGLRGRPFLLWKFRTLWQDAEKTEPPSPQAGDPRGTRIGEWLRKTRLEGFPQLINVLKGDMSLVGPRAEEPLFVHDSREIMPGYHLRHRIRPGITGWTQVRQPDGFSAEGADMKLQYDLFYIKRLSFRFDMKIMTETVRYMWDSWRTGPEDDKEAGAP